MKYRALNKNNEWIYADLEIGSHGISLFNEEIRPETCTCSINMLDENRKEIFVGDIVMAQRFKGVVRYNENNARYEIYDEKYQIGITLKCNPYTKVLPESEIVGNIYENTLHSDKYGL